MAEVTNPENLLGWQQAKQHLKFDELGRPVLEDAKDVQMFAAWLIRTNYVVEVGQLISPSWVAMSEAELTGHLAEKFTEQQLEQKFAQSSELRQLLKNRARTFTMVGAVVIALVWCREDLAAGDYWGAGLKFTATVGGAYAMNRYFYARDKTAAKIMADNMGNFGKWFQGVARTNAAVNFLARRILPALLIWDLRGILMSGGLDGPNIPFDFIIEIDLFDKSTWRKPPEGGLDWGLDFFYYQKPTEQWNCGYQSIQLGVIRGSLLRAPKRWLGIAAHNRSDGVLSARTGALRNPEGGGATSGRGPLGGSTRGIA